MAVVSLLTIISTSLTTSSLFAATPAEMDNCGVKSRTFLLVFTAGLIALPSLEGLIPVYGIFQIL